MYFPINKVGNIKLKILSDLASNEIWFLMQAVYRLYDIPMVREILPNGQVVKNCISPRQIRRDGQMISKYQSIIVARCCINRNDRLLLCGQWHL